MKTATRGEDDNHPITAQDFIREQGKDLYCRSVSSTLGYLGLTYKYDRNGCLTCTSQIDGATQKVVPTSLTARLLYHAYYHIFPSHPGGKSIYDRMKREYYCRHNAGDVFTAVKDCPECPKSKPSDKSRRPLQPFPTSGPLELVGMDILRQLLKTLNGNRYVLEMTDRYSLLTRAVPTSRATV